MTTWLLFLTLANGDSGAIETSQYVCGRVAISVLAGEDVKADVYGNKVRVMRAACHGPTEVNPCEVGAPS